jgi:hypothetical protein
MINGGEWRWAWSDYDTHEADSVPRFGGRRARVTCNVDRRGKKDGDRANTRPSTRQIRTKFRYPVAFDSLGPLP